MSRRPAIDSDAGRSRQLLAAMVVLDDALAGAAPDLEATDRRWSAARTVVAAAARHHCNDASGRADGALFALPADASPGRRRALTLAAAMPLPAVLPPPSLQWLGAAYPELLAPAARKGAGAFFTVPRLAEPTVRRALQPLVDRAAPLRIVDPAVGAGAFLLAALAVRCAAGRSAASVAGAELFGVDLDPTAAHLAALTLHAACGAAAPPLAAIEHNVHHGDGLTAFADGTFDVVVGNPPWETLQLPRTAATSPAAQRELAARLVALRARFAAQGRGKLYTYRLFVERALALLRPGGRLGLLVPASLWFDRDAAPLRDRLLDACCWEWLFGFQNRRRLFAIDTRYRFGAIVAARDGRTDGVRTAFGREDPADWAAAAPDHFVYRRAEVRALSPRSGAFVGVDDARDLDLLRRMVAGGQPLLGSDGAATWRQGDCNMTSDRHRFVPRADAENAGYRIDTDGRWRRGSADPVLRPLYQGGMLGDLHPNAGAFAGGSGRAVRWRPPAQPDAIEPQYLVDQNAVAIAAPARVALRALSNASNERTAIACLLADEPCGNSLGVLVPRAATATPLRDTAFLAGVLGSLAFDWALRRRLDGTNLNAFVLADTVIPRATPALATTIAAAALQLCAVLPWHAPLWQRAAAEGFAPPRTAVDRADRRVRLELAVAQAFGLTADDLDHLLAGCDHPIAALADRRFTRRLDPRGFWRIDRTAPPARRLPVRIRAAARAAD